MKMMKSILFILVWVLIPISLVPKSNNPIKFIKRYGIVRSITLELKEQGSLQSLTKAKLVYGEMVNILSKLDISEGQGGGFENKWVKVKTNRGIVGYCNYRKLLLLDTYQKNLWLNDYRLYKVKALRTRILFDLSSLRWLQKNKKSIEVYLEKGSHIWVQRRTRKNLYFRYLIDSPVYLDAYILLKDAKRSF